uniref:Phospho-2-dehydro-3-deoxyheptonate aldolase, Phe-sensitive Phospho-2-keto-3-deoxyheptonate aldolase; 3-deoxy-D-arabino-heptulosonate 7-phosphate synthase; DAHP synthetase n=1 Tax=Erwinia amylovora ATCC BAA-2158 TaxID=889211 RepID=E5B4Y5_ERWAM|nr:Phospho-2-dehydro-3-deoxyheptonate aldolase, Phe-sensitive Phospho-2-keto-3-deoxyheptonate aldolase; 3-deoxy-D-arabino-heptulosonate 7-phosphate synthase; DAHP synthetase [Erwinia amylovora ATCC BAA-2158]
MMTVHAPVTHRRWRVSACRTWTPPACATPPKSLIRWVMTSALSCPLGLINGVDGNPGIAVEGIRAALISHRLPSPDKCGQMTGTEPAVTLLTIMGDGKILSITRQISLPKTVCY